MVDHESAHPESARIASDRIDRKIVILKQNMGLALRKTLLQLYLEISAASQLSFSCN